MEALAYITYREIFGREIDGATLQADAAALSLNDCLQSLGKLSHLLASHEEREANSLILGGLRYPGAVMLTMAMTRVGRPLLFDKRVLAAARVALLHAQDRDPDGFDEQRDLHRFVELLLGVADVYDRTDVPDGLSVDQQKEWFIGFRLKRNGLPQRSLPASIVRSIRVLVDLPRRRPNLISVAPPTEAFEREVGLTLERYLAICLGIMVRFSVWNREADAWLLGARYWQNTTVEAEEFSRAVTTFGISTKKLRTEIEKDVAAGFDSIDDIYPFIKHPLIEVEKGAYLALDIEALGDKLVGDGLYWRLKYNPGATEQERSDLQAALGHLIEAHCVEVAEAVYADNGRDDTKLFDEISYKKETEQGRVRVEGTDLAIFEADAAAFIEVGIDRPNMLETLIRGDLASFDRDVSEILLHRAEQLDRKIKDYLNGDLIYDGFDPSGTTRIHPVICLLDGFPLGTPLYERISCCLAESGLLQLATMAPVSIISVEEFEYLCGLVERGERLTDVLAGHAASQMNHQESLRDHLLGERKLALQPTTLLKKEFEQITERLKTQLFGDAAK